ncbi:ATP-dependent DNA helicase DinG [Enterococcus faecalis]|nr:ATP-dependent DNA helicase DinG [Enterococcus faecalis]
MKGVKSLKDKQVYAVVDLETTGTDPTSDRIIQFGCVLVQDGKIIANFATDVNPNQVVPKQIQSLTGISNTQVQKAPYFEDVAHTIYHYLEDTIFVAHNVHFDYNFLARELVRCGTPLLTIPAIDTVELAQIFLPTEKSFRLSDLSESLGLSHENPHQADSDAQVTAELLLLIQEKMKSLPLVTMEKIAELSQQTARETSAFIQQTYEQMKKQVTPLNPAYQVVSGIALRKKEVPLFEETFYQTSTYPKTKKAKEKLFGERFAYRAEQSRMMNLVYDHFTEGTTKDLFIEAATGTGKTLGYLLPMSYLATPEKPVIISTVSIVLQNQLVEKDLPLANQICQGKLRGIVIKSHRHYLDLQRFKATLNQPTPQKQYALYQMGVLVWLLETETGDLDELQLTNLNHLFWKEVTHRGLDFLSKKDELYEVDFLRHLYKKVAQSNVLIVNHAFLAQESLRKQPLLPESPWLIIDEAHHLPDIASRMASERVNSVILKKQVTHFIEKEQLFVALQQIFQQFSEEQRLVKVYQQGLLDFVDEWQDFLFELHRLFSKTQKRIDHQELLLTKERIDYLSAAGEKHSQTLQLLLQELLTIQSKLQQTIMSQLETFSLADRIVFVRLFQFFDEIERVHHCFTIYLDDWRPRWVKEYLPQNEDHGLIEIHDLESSLLPETKWYPRYERIIYTSGTLKFGNNKKYLPQRLGLTEVTFKTLPTPYNYAENARVYVPEEAVAIQNASSYEMGQYISDTIEKLMAQEERSVLVLFTSHELLSTVYHQVQPRLLEKGQEVLAQGISGSREKILKRFSNGKTNVLLGADSFWEGVDLPGTALQLLIVTRLPFENPKRPLVQAKYAYLEAEGIQPFAQEAVPKAALRLRQALGRLIRSEEDRGALLILDRRLVTAKYGKRLIKAFPKGLSVKEAPMPEILEELKEFLNK